MISKSTFSKICFFTTIALALIGLIGVIPVSYKTFTAVKMCPMIGVIPACYIVTVGYFLVFLSCLLKKNILFYIGWSPVFLLATIGSVSEIFGKDVCPKTATGIPMCYFSLFFATIVALTFYGWKKTSKNL